MSKDTTFVHGTIVRADYLNADQEANTGAIWSTRLAQSAAGSVETNVIGDPYDTQGPMIIGGKHVWKNGASTAATTSGAAGARNIWVKTNLTTLPDYEVELLDTASTPAEPYYRKIGSASWDGVSTLNNIKFENGVQADANQYNQFTLKTISPSTNDVALTVEGYVTQETSTVLQVGFEDSGFEKRLGFSGNGLAAWTADAATDEIINASQAGDANPRWIVTAEGKLSWGNGTLTVDTFLARGSTGTVKITDGLSGGNGIIDVVALQNSDTGGAAYNGAGMVNVLDDLNLQAGAVIRYDGSELSSSNLADASNIAHLSGTETFTGSKTFSAAQTFNDVVNVDGATALVSRTGTATNSTTEYLLGAKEALDTNYRFSSTVSGILSWSSGTAAPDVTLSRTGANELSMGSGDYLKQSYSPTLLEPDVLVNRGTLDAALASGAASKSFSFFIS